MRSALSASDPLTLAFDTSAAHCAAALLSGGRILDARCEAMAKGQAERLMVLVAEMLDGAGAQFGDVDLIGVGIGPGNFTGIRLSVAAARGLALSTGAPACGVSRLEAATHGMTRPVVSCFDARRDALYLQVFGVAGDGAPRCVARAALGAQDLPMGAAWVGDAAEELAPAYDGRAVPPPEPLAVAIARIALAHRDTPVARPAPLYLRPADAAPAAPPPDLLP